LNPATARQFAVAVKVSDLAIIASDKHWTKAGIRA
jgi:hypothetical protein